MDPHTRYRIPSGKDRSDYHSSSPLSRHGTDPSSTGFRPWDLVPPVVSTRGTGHTGTPWRPSPGWSRSRGGTPERSVSTEESTRGGLGRLTLTPSDLRRVGVLGFDFFLYRETSLPFRRQTVGSGRWRGSGQLVRTRTPGTGRSSLVPLNVSPFVTKEGDLGLLVGHVVRDIKDG